MRSAILYAGICAAAVYIVVRLLYPVMHLESGYVLYAYPFVDAGLCEDNACAVDRSRTGIEIGLMSFLLYGAVRRLRARHRSFE